MYRFVDVPIATTPAVLATVAEAVPTRPFVIAADGLWTYADMAAGAARLALQLAGLGLRRGDRVGILLPNGGRWCASLLGAHAAGLSVVPLNTWYRADELQAVVRRSALRAVITEEATTEAVAGLPGLPGDDAPRPGGERAGSGFVGTFEWPAAADAPPALPPPDHHDPLEVLRAAPVGEADDALLLFTSGSSAEPKAVRLLQGGMVRTGHAIGERQGIRESDRFWFASPLFFVFGCANAVPNALTHAATLCLQERFEAGAALEFIERHRCSVYYAVAPITRALAASDDLGKRDISSLRTGTANATPEDLRLAIEVLGVQGVCNAYGMTEGYGHSTITSHTDPAAVRMSSQGTVLPTQELRIVSGDGTLAGPHAPGAIQIRGTITPGYLDPSVTGAVAFEPGDWFSTGDIGYLDAEGRLHYVGRGHDMMKVKGINISPAEVELVLVRHRQVDEAFVFGIGDPAGDQEVGCVLVSTVLDTEHAAMVADVQRWMRQEVASYKVPTRVWVLRADQLPLTATGKVSKRLLQEQVSG